MIRRICFITDRYPTPEYPMNTFLDQLVCQIADSGVECTVVAPYSRVLDAMKHNNYHPPVHYVKTTEKGNRISVYCPTIFALTGRKIGPLNFGKLYQRLYTNAVRRVLQENKTETDVFYGHFITPAGIAAAEMGKLHGKPSFLAYGECFIEQDSCIFTLEEIRSRLADLCGVIAVSTKNRDELLTNRIADAGKIGVFPNAIKGSRFYRTDRKAVREKLGFSQDDFIVAFMGHFIERKGVLRVSEALKGIDGIKSIFIGSGPQKPDCPGILFSGRLPHEQIVTYLNAADVFVLPTLAEGCCNAIVEAMACGLPIISSNLPFNDDILNDTNSIRTDPRNIEEIRNAIKKLYANEDLRNALSAGSMKTAAGLTIEERAAKILAFLENRIMQQRK